MKSKKSQRRGTAKLPVVSVVIEVKEHRLFVLPLKVPKSFLVQQARVVFDGILKGHYRHQVYAIFSLEPPVLL